MQRADCRSCDAIVVEEVPWADGKRTRGLSHFLGKRFLTPSNMSSPEDGSIAHRARSTPLASMKSSTPRRQIPGLGLLDRHRHHPSALGRQGANHRIIPGILHCHGPGSHFQELARLGGTFLDEWRRQTMRSRIAPMKKIARHSANTANSSSDETLITRNYKSFPPIDTTTYSQLTPDY
jgi:hypothetical protein